MKVYIPIKLGKTRENLPIGIYSDFEKAKSIVVESIVAEVQTWDVLASSIVAVDRDTSNQEHVVLERVVSAPDYLPITYHILEYEVE